MQTSKTRKMIGRAAAAALAMTTLSVGATAVQAQTLIPGVTGCGAQGVKQERGALIGALAGGLLGNSVSGHNRTTGTVVGAAVGAAAGSAIGCQMQHNEQQSAYGYGAPRGGYAPATYRSGGYELASAVRPARYERLRETLVAADTVNLRAAPTTGSARVGKLRAGERFEALAEVRGSDWLLVGDHGVGVGYVHRAFVRPAGQRYAYGY